MASSVLMFKLEIESVRLAVSPGLLSTLSVFSFAPFFSAACCSLAAWACFLTSSAVSCDRFSFSFFDSEEFEELLFFLRGSTGLLVAVFLLGVSGGFITWLESTDFFCSPLAFALLPLSEPSGFCGTLPPLVGLTMIGAVGFCGLLADCELVRRGSRGGSFEGISPGPPLPLLTCCCCDAIRQNIAALLGFLREFCLVL